MFKLVAAKPLRQFLSVHFMKIAQNVISDQELVDPSINFSMTLVFKAQGMSPHLFPIPSDIVGFLFDDCRAETFIVKSEEAGKRKDNPTEMRKRKGITIGNKKDSVKE